MNKATSITCMKECQHLNYSCLCREFGCPKEIGNKIRTLTDLHGFVIVKGVEFDFNLESASLFLTELSSHVGTLVPHNLDREDFVWKIQSKVSTSSLKTFSEHSHQAPLHTDSQYRNRPERFIALMALNQASCSGGSTNLLDFKKVISELKANAIGRKIVEFISDQDFPIAIPSIFQENDAKTYISARLISKAPLIRYRYDTLKAGLSLIEHSKIKIFHDTLDLLNEFIEESQYRINFKLPKNEILFIDNHRFLHGRTSFVDLNRLLIRTRMN